MGLLNFLILIFLVSTTWSCNQQGRSISSIEDFYEKGAMTNEKFDARLLTLTPNLKEVQITGNCVGDQNIYLSGSNLANNQKLSTDCTNDRFEISVRFKEEIEGRQEFTVSQGKRSKRMIFSHVDTKKPAPVIVDTPLPGYLNGKTLYFSGKCEHKSLVNIRSFYIDDLIKTVKCSHGIFFTPLYLKNIYAKRARLLFALNQVDSYGNSSEFIMKIYHYREENHSIFIDEKISGTTDGYLSLTGNCKSYTNVSVAGKIVPCKNDRFEYNFKLEESLQGPLYHLPVQGLKKGYSSNVSYFYYYKKRVQKNAKFFSPIGQYFSSEKDQVVISGTCGRMYGESAVRLFTSDKQNILIEKDVASVDADGKFFISSDEFDLGESREVFAECINEYVSYDGLIFKTSFEYVPDSGVSVIKNNYYVSEFDFSLNGRCFKNAVVNILNVRLGTSYIVDCINGKFQLDLMTNQYYGINNFEVSESDIFSGREGIKSIVRVNYDLFIQHPLRVSFESATPFRGSLDNSVRLYWEYPKDNQIDYLQYGIYSKESLIQVEWQPLPKGVEEVRVYGRELINLGYVECSDIQIYLQAIDKKKRLSSIVKSKKFYFDFTAPPVPEISSVDYRPLFDGKLPIFRTKEYRDNCDESALNWYQVYLYRIDENGNKTVMEDFFISDLTKVNNSGIKYNETGNFQVGIRRFDVALNFSQEYQSIVFSWK